MALTKEQKAEVIQQTTDLLAAAKMTVVAKYPGTSVRAIQELRKTAQAEGTLVRVIKNRLFKKALESNDNLNGLDTSSLTGQLLYAFNPDDEVAPAQNLAAFARTNPQLEFVCGLSAEGKLLSASEVTMLANLPSKPQLKAQLVGAIAAPLSGFVNVIAGNVRAIFNVLNARAEYLSK